MSKNQRSLYFILHAVQSMATGMLSTGGLQKKSRDSLQRILNRVEREMESLGPINENDARHLRRAGEALRDSWAVNGEEQLSRPAQSEKSPENMRRSGRDALHPLSAF